jgi:hypothetical protein
LFTDLKMREIQQPEKYMQKYVSSRRRTFAQTVDVLHLSQSAVILLLSLYTWCTRRLHINDLLNALGLTELLL